MWSLTRFPPFLGLAYCCGCDVSAEAIRREKSPGYALPPSVPSVILYFALFCV